MDSLPPPPSDLLDGAALFLDFDGTLVELAATPDAIRVAPGLAPMLARLRARLNGHLAIVSGRAIADLERYLPLQGIAVSGSHGLELRRADGTGRPLGVPANLSAVRQAVAGFAAGRIGLLVEEKPAGVALHYRLAPETQDEVEKFMATLAHTHGFLLQCGKMVAELRPHGANKGDAVRAFMTEPGFQETIPIFVGDDLTDEHAFEAVAALGGAGVLVGPARVTAACYRLPSVTAVAQWLESAA